MNQDQEAFDEEQKLYLGDFKLWGRLFKSIVPQWKWVLVAVGLAFIITATSPLSGLDWSKWLWTAISSTTHCPPRRG